MKFLFNATLPASIFHALQKQPRQTKVSKSLQSSLGYLIIANWNIMECKMDHQTQTHPKINYHSIWLAQVATIFYASFYCCCQTVLLIRNPGKTGAVPDSNRQGRQKTRVVPAANIGGRNLKRSDHSISVQDKISLVMMWIL